VVEWTEEENYKFRLSSFKQSLIDWLEASPDCQYRYWERSPVSRTRN
jgi:methionyl-tRNA synthetase